MRRIIKIFALCALMFVALGCNKAKTYVDPYGTAVSCQLNGEYFYRENNRSIEYRQTLGDCYMSNSSFVVKVKTALIERETLATAVMNFVIASSESFGLNVKYDISSVNNQYDISSYSTFEFEGKDYTATEGWVMFDSIEVLSDNSSCFVGGSFGFTATDKTGTGILEVQSGSFSGIQLNFFDSSVLY